MYSYPNYIPLPASEVRRIGNVMARLTFDRVYGAWWGKLVESGAKLVVRRSVERYVGALEGRPPSTDAPRAVWPHLTNRKESVE